MTITKLKWQWQSSSSTHDPAYPQPSTPNPLTGRVITGMLTGGHTDLLPPAPRTRGSSSNDSGF